MSTKITIGVTGNIHLYIDVAEDRVFLEREKGPYEVFCLMSEEEWEEIEDQIIASRFQKIQNGYGIIPYVWDDSHFLNKETLLENLKKLIEKLER